jgi:hypothetical protein
MTSRVIQGSAAELIERLQGLRDHDGLMLLVPAAPDSNGATQAEHQQMRRIRNGVPLFERPVKPLPVTLEDIKRLDDED